MLYLKIIVSILLIVLPIIEIIRDSKVSDRSNHYRQLTRFILYSYSFIAFFTIILLWYESMQANNQQHQVDKLVTGNNTLLSENMNLKNELLLKNSELLSEIYKYQAALEKKEDKIKVLEQKAKLAARGVVSKYDFVGDRIESENQHRALAEKKCKEKILAEGTADFTPAQIVKVDIFSEISSEESRFEFLVSVIYHMNDRDIDTQHFLECTATKKDNGLWVVLVEGTAKRSE